MKKLCFVIQHDQGCPGSDAVSELKSALYEKVTDRLLSTLSPKESKDVVYYRETDECRIVATADRFFLVYIREDDLWHTFGKRNTVRLLVHVFLSDLPHGTCQTKVINRLMLSQDYLNVKTDVFVYVECPQEEGVSWIKNSLDFKQILSWDWVSAILADRRQRLKFVLSPDQWHAELLVRAKKPKVAEFLCRKKTAWMA